MDSEEDTNPVLDPLPEVSFLLALSAWRNKQRKSMIKHRNSIVICKQRPVGARYDFNLYQDAEGETWSMGTNVLHRLERSAGRLSPYKIVESISYTPGQIDWRAGDGYVATINIPERQMYFVRRSSESIREDWGWVSDPSIPSSESATHHYQRECREAEHCCHFADILLAKQAEICTWLSQHAHAFDRHSEAWRMDWGTFVIRFTPHIKEDSLSNVGALRIALHETLDELAGCKGIRDYHS